MKSPVTVLRRRSVYVWLAVVAWAAALVMLWPAAARMGDGESDAATIELVSGSDSAQVRALLDAADSEPGETAVVVVARDGGLTDADRAWLDARRHDLATGAGAAEYRIGEIAEAADAKAVLFPVTHPHAEGAVDRARAAVAASPPGLTALVTGPAALDVDADDIEAGTDERLLLTTAAVVIVLLVLTYRSPVLWLFPLIAVAGSLTLAQALVTGFGELGGEYSGLTGKIMTVLVFGVGTDYALLLVARYREELTATADRFAAMRRALRHTAKTVLTAATTVIGGVLCLLLTSVPETRALGPTLALAIAATAFVMLTLFPAMLLAGRWVFWPRIPRPGATVRPARLWDRISLAVAARPVRTALAGTALLLSLAQGVGVLQWGLDPLGQFRNPPEAVTGLRTVAAHFPTGATGAIDAPVVLARPADAERARLALLAQPGVTRVEPAGAVPGWTTYHAHLEALPFTRAAQGASSPAPESCLPPPSWCSPPCRWSGWHSSASPSPSASCLTRSSSATLSCQHWSCASTGTGPVHRPPNRLAKCRPHQTPRLSI